MTNFYLTEVEEDREDATQRLPCPTCGAKRGKRCSYLAMSPGGPGWALTSHTGRYLAAVDAGLVPAFAGGRRG